MRVRLAATSGREVPMRLIAGIEVSAHDCAMLVHRAGVAVGCPREVDGDETAPAISEEATNHAVGIRPAPHDLAAFINLPAESSSGIREIKRGEFAVVQHKTMVIVSRLKASDEGINPGNHTL